MLLADYNEELKRLPKFGGLVYNYMHFSDKVTKIGGTESLEYGMPCMVVHENIMLTMVIVGVVRLYNTS